MEKQITCRKCFAINISPVILAILLALFLAVNAAGQTDAEFASDTAQMGIYSKLSKSPTISVDSAIEVLSMELALAKKHDMRKRMGRVWMYMAARNLQKRDLAGGERCLDSAFKLNDQLKDPELTVQINDMAAWLYKRKSNNAKAASCYFRAVQAIEENKIENNLAIAKLYNNLGIFMFEQNESSSAKKYLLLARQHILKTQPVDTATLINIYVILGMSQYDADSTAAIGYFNNAYALVEQSGNRPLSYSTMANLSMGYMMIKRYSIAEHFLGLTKSLAAPGESMVMIEMLEGSIDYHTKKYADAEKHLLNALELTHNEMDNTREEIYENLAALYEEQGDYRKAFKYQEKFVEHYKLHKADTKKTVTDFMLSIQALEHERAILLKQAEISLQEAAIKRQKTWMVMMGLVAVLACTVLVLAYRSYRHKRSLLSQQMRTLVQEQEIERLKAEAEGADSERSRIAYDIHDGVLVRLGNVKMNLSGLSAMQPGLNGGNRYGDVMEQLDLATRELRNTAHNLMPEILLEEGMAQAIFYFCKATEQSSGLAIRFQQVGAPFPRLQPQVETSIYRIVQGIMQNIVQHAGAATALVQLQYADHLCSITIEDNGKGINDVRSSEGYGIKSIRNRIQILKGTFDIDSKIGQGTTVYFEFDARPFMQTAFINQ